MKQIFQFMINRKVLPVVLIVMFAGVFWAFQSRGGNGEGLTNQEKLLTTLGAIIQQNHYEPKALNDNFSQQIFKKFLNAVDPDKNIFLQSDVQSLKKFENSIDDEINGAVPVQFVPAVNQIFTKRMAEVNGMYKELLQKPFDFTVNEELVLDTKRINFPKDEATRKDMWRKKLKFLTLERYNELLDTREKNKDKKRTTRTEENRIELN